MAWTIEFTKVASKQLGKLDRQIAARLVNFVRNHPTIRQDPRSDGKPLTGELKNHWCYRVGDFRLLCKIYDDRLIVMVVSIGDRKEVYR